MSPQIMTQAATSASPDAALEAFVVVGATTNGYAVTLRSSTIVCLTRESRPIWTIVLAIVLFPIGLLFLLIKKSENINVVATADENSTRVQINGSGSGDMCNRMTAVLASLPSVQPPEV